LGISLQIRQAATRLVSYRLDRSETAKGLKESGKWVDRAEYHGWDEPAERSAAALPARRPGLIHPLAFLTIGKPGGLSEKS